MGYIDGIHGAPYIAAPWILWDIKFYALRPSNMATWRGKPIET